MAEREGLVTVWARRAVSFPAYVVGGTAYLGGLPLWLSIACLVDVLRGARALPRTRAVAFFALYFVCELVGLTGAALLWVGTLGGILVGKARWLEANARLQSAWSSALFFGSTSLFSMKVEVAGDDVSNGPVVVLVRHTSTADTVLTAALVANPNALRLRYVMKRELLWDPCLDVVGRRIPNAFLDRAARKRGDDIDAIRELAQDLDRSSGVLIYPEGTRFTAAKLERALDRLRQTGDDQLSAIGGRFSCVLPPKVGGTLALLEVAPDADVVFVEHRGFEGAGSFAEFWQGGLIGKTVSVRIRRVEAAEIPAERRDLWLFEQWLQLDEWLKA